MKKESIKKEINNILKKLQKISKRKLESKDLIRQYLEESLTIGNPITFYNWECPPRFLDKTKKGEIFINFDVGLEKITQGKKIDRFTEIPRVVEKAKEEKRILNFIKSLGFKFRFSKLIADTNAIFLAPRSVEILGKRKIIRKFNDFKLLVEQRVRSYPVITKVFLFTEFLRLKGYETIYRRTFLRAYRIIKECPKKFISGKTLKEQFKRTRKHVGLSDPEAIKEFSLRTIASYGTEGIIFVKLTQTKEFSNCVWLNIEEQDKRTIEITNFLRKLQGTRNLPIIFAN